MFRSPVYALRSRALSFLRHERRSLFTNRTTPAPPPLSPPLSNLTAIFLTASGLASAGLFAAYAFDSRAGIHKWLVMPLMHTFLDAEDAHRLSCKAAGAGLCPKDRKDDSDSLGLRLFGFDLANPIGLAAGYDKHGEAIDAMFDVGFGMVEIGSVTPEPQPGNAKPRMFRLPEDGGVINRYGFNSEGHESVLTRLKYRMQHYAFSEAIPARSDDASSDQNRPLLDFPSTKSLRDRKILGVNLGKNKASLEESVDDYVKGVNTFGAHADYLVVNISSPNTPGLRGLQKRERLEKLVKQVLDARNALPVHPPLLIKIAPDLSSAEVEDVSKVAIACGIDGIIVSNTTIKRPNTLKSAKSVTEQAGGLSGAPVKPFSLSVLKQLYRLTDGKIPLIGCGGISNADDALEFARAGASAVQIYTSMGYKGPGIVRDIKDGVAAELERNRQRWSDIVGVDVKSK